MRNIEMTKRTDWEFSVVVYACPLATVYQVVRACAVQFRFHYLIATPRICHLRSFIRFIIKLAWPVEILLNEKKKKKKN